MKLPDEKLRQDARDVVLDFIDWSKQYRDSHLEEIETWGKHYEVKESLRTYDGRAHTADGSTHENVETIVPRLVEIISENGSFRYEVGPVDSNADPELVKAINPLISYDMKMSKSRTKIVEALREVAKKGTIVVSCPYESEKRTRTVPRYELRPIEFDEYGQPTVWEQYLLGYEKKTETLWSGVNWDLVDLMSCYLDPLTPDIDKAQGIVIEDQVAFEDLRKEQIRTEIIDVGENPVKVKVRRGHYFQDALDEVEKTFTTEDVEKKSGDEKGNVKKPQPKRTPRKMVNIKVYRGFFDYDGDGIAEDCVITLATKQDIVIQLEPADYPRRPYFIVRYLAIKGQTYGLGICGLMTKTQQTINDLQNQVLDDATFSLLPMWRKTPGGASREEYMEAQPHKIHYADPGELERFDTSMQLTHGWNAIEYSQENARRITGAYRTLQAQPMKYNTTATEVSTMQSEASARPVTTGIVLEEEFAVQLLERIVQYNHEFMEPGKIARITDDPELERLFLETSSEDIARQYDFTPLGATTYQRQLKQREEIMQFTQAVRMVLEVMASAGPTLQQTGFDAMRLLRDIAATFNFPDSDKIFPDNQQQQQLTSDAGMSPMGGGENGTGDPMDIESVLAQFQGVTG